jgi:predicted transcriptional regulator
MGTHVSTVSRSIAELEQCGLIEIERRGQGKTNFYTVNFVVRAKSAKADLHRCKSRFAPIGFWICRSAIHSI